MSFGHIFTLPMFPLDIKKLQEQVKILSKKLGNIVEGQPGTLNSSLDTRGDGGPPRLFPSSQS